MSAKHGGSPEEPVLSGEGQAANTYLFDGVWMEERAALDRLFNKFTGLGLL